MLEIKESVEDKESESVDVEMGSYAEDEFLCWRSESVWMKRNWRISGIGEMGHLILRVLEMVLVLNESGEFAGGEIGI